MAVVLLVMGGGKCLPVMSCLATFIVDNYRKAAGRQKHGGAEGRRARIEFYSLHTTY